MREHNIEGVFYATIRGLPDLAVLIAGGAKGIVELEYEAAAKAGVSFLPIVPTGGMARKLKSTADKLPAELARELQTDRSWNGGDLADFIIKAIQEYASE